MGLPAADHFCVYVMFGIVGTFQRVYKCSSPGSVGELLVAVGFGLLNSLAQRRNNKKKLARYPSTWQAEARKLLVSFLAS